MITTYQIIILYIKCADYSIKHNYYNFTANYKTFECTLTMGKNITHLMHKYNLVIVAVGYMGVKKQKPPGTVFKVVKNHSEQENNKKYYEIKKIKHWVDRFVGNIVKIKLLY